MTEQKLTNQEIQALDNLVALLDENELENPLTQENTHDPDRNMDVIPTPHTQVCTLKNKSTLYPSPSSNPNAAAFLKLVSTDINRMKNFPHPYSNFSRDERLALEALSRNHDVVIKPSDKGGNVVVMDSAQYTEMCMDILQNHEWYRPIPKSLLDKFTHDFYTLVDTAFQYNAISKQLWEFIRTSHPKEATFYALPKLHKQKKKPPGRPIISGCGSLTENLSRVVDNHLKPLVTCLSSYVRDTIHFLQIIQDIHIEEGTQLVAIDVESLYCTIPHAKGLSAIQHILQQYSDSEPKYIEFILASLEFILNHNFFCFDGSHYLQVQGVAMGTCCAPSYANLYLGEWEHSLLVQESLSVYMRHVITWRRYIDDIFMIWDGPTELLHEFLNCINKNDFNLKFTMTHSPKEITFLDVLVQRSPDGNLSSELYRKPTAGNSLLHASSFHPKPLLTSIPYSQYLRARRNCSDDTRFKMEANALKKRLLERGYSNTCLKKAYKRALNQSRRDLLNAQKQPSKDETIRIITTYSSEHRQIKRILNKYWHLLTMDQTLAPFVPSAPTVTYRRPPSIGDKIVNSEYKTCKGDPCKVLGTYMCGGCHYCQYMDKRKNIILPNGQRFTPKHYVNCKTPAIVYLLTCECGCYYVGKTINEFWKRIYQHLGTIRKRDPDLPIGRHMAMAHPSSTPKVYFLALDRIHFSPRGGDSNKRLLQCELRWIHNLRANHPPGLNGAFNFKPFLPGFTSGVCELDL
ncbi:uncharacterized protein [Aquarana catesbeiana]|uniref:uncharacterized protein n=1 Tax=Aquarana catesbeiana TaxID=8400 RepID=UPI003CC9EAEB